MSDRIKEAFLGKEPVLSMYVTAGFPTLNDAIALCEECQNAGARMLEIGIPYSDPIADGLTVQRANTKALENGITLSLALSQISEMRKKVTIPIIVMGYFNPVLQYGVERFCRDAVEAGVDGVILPDLPLSLYNQRYRALFEEVGLKAVFLVTSETSDERIHAMDEASDSFLYVVSSHSVTGGSFELKDDRAAYFKRLREMKLRNPLVVGFGIDGREAFLNATRYTDGAIIASAFLRALFESNDIRRTTREFIGNVLERREA